MLSFSEMLELMEGEQPDYTAMTKNIFAALDALKKQQTKARPPVKSEPEVSGSVQAPKPTTQPAAEKPTTPPSGGATISRPAVIKSAEPKKPEPEAAPSPVRTQRPMRAGKRDRLRQKTFFAHGVGQKRSTVAPGEEENQFAGSHTVQYDKSGMPLNPQAGVKVSDQMLGGADAEDQRDPTEVLWDQGRREKELTDELIGRGMNPELARVRAVYLANQEWKQKFGNLQVRNTDQEQDVLARTEIVKLLANQVTHEDISRAKPGIHRDILKLAPKADFIYDRLFNKKFGGINKPGREVPEQELIQHVATDTISPEMAKAALDTIATASIHDSRIPQILTKVQMQSADKLGPVGTGYKFHLDAMRAGANPSLSSQAQDAKERAMAPKRFDVYPSGTRDPKMSEAPPAAAPKQASTEEALRAVQDLENKLEGKMNAIELIFTHLPDGKVTPEMAEPVTHAVEEATKIFRNLHHLHSSAIDQFEKAGDLDNYIGQTEKLKAVIDATLNRLNNYRMKVGLPPVK